MKDTLEPIYETSQDTQNQPEGEETPKDRTEDFEIALKFFQSQLWKAKGGSALHYLTKTRGYTEEEIEAMELGFFPFEKLVRIRMRKILKRLGFDKKEFGKTHKIVIPYRDPEGKLKGFVVRRLGGTKKPKYLYTSGLERTTLFNHNVAKGLEHIIVVGGYFDSLISTARGIQGVVAIGDAQLTEKMLEDITRYGAKSITLIPDNNEREFKNTEKSLKLIREKGLNSFVIELPVEYQDLDEFIRMKGKEGFEKLRKHAKDGYKWEAKESLDKLGNIKVRIRTATPQTTQVYFIKKGSVTRQKESDA